MARHPIRNAVLVLLLFLGAFIYFQSDTLDVVFFHAEYAKPNARNSKVLQSVPDVTVNEAAGSTVCAFQYCMETPWAGAAEETSKHPESVRRFRFPTGQALSFLNFDVDQSEHAPDPELKEAEALLTALQRFEFKKKVMSYVPVRLTPFTQSSVARQQKLMLSMKELEFESNVAAIYEESASNTRGFIRMIEPAGKQRIAQLNLYDNAGKTVPTIFVSGPFTQSDLNRIIQSFRPDGKH